MLCSRRISAKVFLSEGISPPAKNEKNMTNREIKNQMLNRTANWMAEQAPVRVPTAAELAAELAAEEAEAAHNIATAAADRAAYAAWQASELVKKAYYHSPEAVAARAASKIERADFKAKKASRDAEIAGLLAADRAAKLAKIATN